MAILSKLKYYVSSVVGLLYPDYCPGCGEPLVFGEHNICMNCVAELPYTYFVNSRQNIVSELLIGRFKFEHTFSLCYFLRSSYLQNLLHKLKYNDKPEIGTELGIYLGQDMEKIGMNSFDLIMPIPLHYKKKKLRGYNQSEAIAKGIQRIIEKPIDTSSVQRTVYTETQTKKDKAQRWDNVKDIFEVKKQKKLVNKHILLVDDVITTGATIESMATTILKIPNTTVSIASIAVAKKM